jgi:hypothetical protein
MAGRTGRQRQRMQISSFVPFGAHPLPEDAHRRRVCESVPHDRISSKEEKHAVPRYSERPRLRHPWPRRCCERLALRHSRLAASLECLPALHRTSDRQTFDLAAVLREVTRGTANVCASDIRGSGDAANVWRSDIRPCDGASRSNSQYSECLALRHSRLAASLEYLPALHRTSERQIFVAPATLRMSGAQTFTTGGER